ncbi:MAG: tRNA lysidine(34) synthetase TilS [Lachnospiraceae bacterium]|nr:tRNA lysidine(34) synthetase TilS [Lachnospiraceae bacterium]
MYKTVKNFLREQNLLSGSGIVSGLSGGADSVCLLLILSDLSKESGFPLHAVHVHHGIRKEGADRDESFCEELCRKLGVAFHGVRIDVPKEAKEAGIGEEEAGRLARYRVFREVAQETGCAAVAVAHHRDDNAETLLFRLCRGTGIRGLCGIPEVSFPYEGTGIRVIRPLLPFSRGEILAELDRRGASYCQDETNAENSYTRNYIRNEVMPMLSTVNARASEHIAALAGHAALLTELLDRETEEAYRVAFCGGTLSREKLEAYPRIVRREVLLRFAKELAGAEKDFTEQHAEAMEQLLDGPVSGELSLPYRLTLYRTYDGICRKPEGGKDGREIPLVPGTYPLSDGRMLAVTVRDYVPGEPVPKKKWIKWLDYDMIKDVPVLRTRREGDFFRIGREGGTKLLREYFVTEKVPEALRDRIPVAAAGSEILWIPGERGTERYYVGETTKRIMILEVQEERD